MGPKGAKTARNGRKCPQNGLKPGTKVPLCKATLSPCVWASNSGLVPVGGQITAKNGLNTPLEAEMGQKRGQNSPKWAQMPPTDPKPRTKVPLCNATLSPCV